MIGMLHSLGQSNESKHEMHHMPQLLVSLGYCCCVVVVVQIEPSHLHV
jgi:hypothetical protein